VQFGKLHKSQGCWVTIQVNVQFYPQACFEHLSRRLIARTASATETIANKPTIAAFGDLDDAAVEILVFT